MDPWSPSSGSRAHRGPEEGDVRTAGPHRPGPLACGLGWDRSVHAARGRSEERARTAAFLVGFVFGSVFFVFCGPRLPGARRSERFLFFELPAVFRQEPRDHAAAAGARASECGARSVFIDDAVDFALGQGRLTSAEAREREPAGRRGALSNSLAAARQALHLFAPVMRKRLRLLLLWCGISENPPLSLRQLARQAGPGPSLKRRASGRARD
ncbi:hypothetical protein HPB50_007995 [Hyalomma asiaticum]|uniref:Uncharacterized protein n=1 Tax=Hyalomma asiaticum TaxID=266040 RepID=A0ACB7RYM4_HYAAI|nr:hypothetical protein HPB50_007995 [Hyalomma asiaticum]